RPKYPLYEKLRPTPLLFANSLLFLLIIIILTGAFKDYNILYNILNTRLNLRSNFRIIE
ncbi:hypothetical protein QBC40DRAFT_162399, partial [Triangularia verruculosa]